MNMDCDMRQIKRKSDVDHDGHVDMVMKEAAKKKCEKTNEKVVNTEFNNCTDSTFNWS